MRNIQQKKEKQSTELQDKQPQPGLQNGQVTVNHGLAEDKENKSANPVQNQILRQNKQILENQKKLKSERVFAKVNAENLNKNQNYTVVPNNSQVSYVDKPSRVVKPFQFKEAMEQPDEDCREDYNLLTANGDILKGLAERNQ